MIIFLINKMPKKKGKEKKPPTHCIELGNKLLRFKIKNICFTFNKAIRNSLVEAFHNNSFIRKQIITCGQPLIGHAQSMVHQNGFNILKLTHETTKFKALPQVCKFDPSPSTWARILWIIKNLLRSCNLVAIATPLVSFILNNPIFTYLAFHLLNKKSRTKDVMHPFWNP